PPRPMRSCSPPARERCSLPPTAGTACSSASRRCARAGITLRVPAGIDGLCCGTPWSSKGMGTGLDTMRERTLAALLDASEDGALPIVCDASSCTEGLLAAVEAQVPGRLRIVDAIAFVAERVLPH